jgi:hypothetical protein
MAPLVVGTVVVLAADAVDVEAGVPDAGIPPAGVPGPQALSNVTSANDAAARIMLPQYRVAIVAVHGAAPGSG